MYGLKKRDYKKHRQKIQNHFYLIRTIYTQNALSDTQRRIYNFQWYTQLASI